MYLRTTLNFWPLSLHQPCRLFLKACINTLGLCYVGLVTQAFVHARKTFTLPMTPQHPELDCFMAKNIEEGWGDGSVKQSSCYGSTRVQLLTPQRKMNVGCGCSCPKIPVQGWGWCVETGDNCGVFRGSSLTGIKQISRDSTWHPPWCTVASTPTNTNAQLHSHIGTHV